MIRVDAHLSPNDSLFARFSASSENRATPSAVAFNGTTEQQAGKNIAIDYTHVFTSNFINDLRFGLNRPTTHQLADGAGKNNFASVFSGVDTQPETWGAPAVDFYGDWSNFGGNANSPLNYFTTDAKLSDSVTWIHGPHTIQAGADVAKERFTEANSLLGRGLVFFTGFYTSDTDPMSPAFFTGGNAFADFLLGDAYFAEVNQGNYTGWYNSWNESGFVQDNWKLGNRLTLNLGVRYDYLAPLREEDNRGSVVDLNYPGGRFLTANQAAVTAANNPLVAYTPARDLVVPTKDAWQPRVGLSYRPFGNTVIRTGYGIYYDSNEFNEYIFPVINAPFENTYSKADSTVLFSPIQMDTLFPNAGLKLGSIAAHSLDRNSRRPYVQQWNFDIQQELRGNIVAEVGYIGSEGTHLQDRRQAAQGQLSNPGPTATVNWPYQNFSSILLTEDASSSNYNALIARFEKRFSNGFSLLANYTWSKALGTTSALGNLGTGNALSSYQNGWDKRADYGPLGFDVTHNFVFSPIWELPFGHGKAIAANAPSAVNAVIGGWQAEGIFSARSGVPFSITATDASGTNGSASAARASLVSGQNPYAKTPGKAFNTAAFIQPGTGTFGNSGNNMMRGLGLNNTDFSLIKNTTIHESLGFQLRIEAFNTFNQKDLGPYPGASVGNAPMLGLYESIQHEARILQAALKVNF
jgi:hypothetical protein